MKSTKSSTVTVEKSKSGGLGIKVTNRPPFPPTYPDVITMYIKVLEDLSEPLMGWWDVQRLKQG